jgi:hypothetical protein
MCFGTTTGDANIDIFYDTAPRAKFNVAPNLALPHIANLDDPDSGIVVSDATTPFTWVDEGVAKMTFGLQGSRTYWCFGPWSSATTPCFTSEANDLVMKYSDGTTFTGNLDLGAGHFRLKNGTAAAPSIVWNNDNTGFYRSASDKFSVSINGTFAGHLAEYDTTAMGLEPASGYYLKFDAIVDPAAAGVTADCDSVNESGRIIYDYTNDTVMVCNDVSGTRAGWDTLPALTF